MGYSEWKEYKLGELAKTKWGFVDGPFGSNLPASDYVEFGIPVIRGVNLSKGLSRFKDDKFIFVSDATAKRLERSKCYSGDIIFTKKGTLGQIGIIPKDSKYKEYLLSSNQMKLTVNNDLVDNEYVYYYLSSKISIEKIIQDSEHTGVPKINLSYLKSFPIKLPILNSQKNISLILSSLDEKIELNRLTNQTLEAIAQTLFKEMCVPKGKLLMEGWKLGKFSEIAEQVKININPLQFPDKLFHHYSLPAFDINEVPAYDLGETIMSNKTIVKSYSVLFSKLNPRIPRIWSIGNIDQNISVSSTEFIGFVPKKSHYYSFINFFLKQSETINTLIAHATGTSSSHQRVNPSGILNLDLVIPLENIIDKFNEVVKPFLEMRFQNIKEIQTLTIIRNNLLPKLMKGEISI